ALREALDHLAHLGLRGAPVTGRRRHVVVGGGDGGAGPPYGTPALREPIERAGGSLVQQVAVDVEQAPIAGTLTDDVPVPDLLEHRARRRHGSMAPGVGRIPLASLSNRASAGSRPSSRTCPGPRPGETPAPTTGSGRSPRTRARSRADDP